MCRIMDELRLETEKKRNIEIAQNLLLLGKIRHDEIAQATGLSIEEVKALAGQAAS